MTPRQKVLLVDDVAENLQALEALLTGADRELLFAESGREALELLLEHDVAVALIDVQMPEMDGFELAELMRGTERTRSVPVIFITAGTRDQKRVFQGYEAGAVDFLFKPILPLLLQNKVETFLRLRRQHDQLAETLRIHEMFVAVLGHDLRNPLQSVLSGAALIRSVSHDDRVRRTADRIMSGSARMARLVSDLLDLSLARNGGGFRVTPEPTELGSLIERIRTEQEAARSGATIRFEHHGDLCGEWDAHRLEQVIANLLSNALTHGKPGSDVFIRVDGEQRDGVRVEVHNEGVIPAELIPRIFEPFHSGQPSDSKKGLGLGLFIVRQIVNAHEGWIDVHSDARDGTRFVIFLPRKSANVAAAAD